MRNAPLMQVGVASDLAWFWRAGGFKKHPTLSWLCFSRLRHAQPLSQAQNQTTGSHSQRNPSSGRGIWSALIQFAAVCFETMCKRCGQVARIFCTYLQRAGGNSELMRTESRGRDFPEAGPNPPSRVQYSAQPPSISS